LRRFDIGEKRINDRVSGVTSLLRKVRYPRRCYAVCAVARSGSNLLTDGLHAMRRAGRPNQFFCALFETTYAEKYGLDPQRNYAGYVRGIIEATSTSNQVFGFKLMGWYIDSFAAKLKCAFNDASGLELLEKVFPRLKLIRIRRRDKLRQAISKARAYQSGQWKVRENEEIYTSANFDPALIDQCLIEIEREEAAWSRFFERTGAASFAVCYEELCRDYEGTLRGVLDFLQIRLPRRTQIGSPLTIRQRDELSREWEERYLSLNRSTELVHS
jgi:trehalose 2-sulfotransferase